MKPRVTKTESVISSAWPDAPEYYDARPEGIDVYSWSPAPPGTAEAKTTQVHLHIPLAIGRVVMRFKGPDTLDAVIDALIDHRTEVFGPRLDPKASPK